jgi:hypothetical protein
VTRSYEIDDGRIRLADAVLVYVERTYRRPAPMRPGTAPRAYGRALLAMSRAGEVLAPVPAGEAIWLGFQPVDPDHPVAIRVRLEGDSPIDAVSGEPWAPEMREAPRNYLVCPPDYWLAGVMTEAGCVQFGACDGKSRFGVVASLTSLTHGRRTGQVAIRLLTSAAFGDATGLAVEPIDPDNAYKGWRLP